MVASSFDYFGYQVKPPIVLCNPDRFEVYSLEACYDTDIKLKYNAQSEFNFSFRQTINGVYMDAYDYLEGKRVVYIKNIGYFVISDIKLDDDGSVPVKQVSCLSQESELVYKKIALYSGTFLFYNPSNPTDINTIMGYMLYLSPNWSIGSIDSNLLNIYRTFNVSDTNVYQFLTSDVATECNCIFVFDSINRTISAIYADQDINKTDIFLSHENLIKNTEIKEVVTEITTAMYCYGGGDLTIRNVNPLGTDVIYNFTNFLNSNWMSQDLIDAVNKWQSSIDSAQSGYANLVTQLNNYEATLITQENTLVDLNTQLSSDQNIYQAQLAQGLDTTAILAAIAVDNANITSACANINQTQFSINSIDTQLITVNNNLSIRSTNNFTPSQYASLSSFIYENSYKNQSIVTTDSMTTAQIQTQCQQLYDISKTVLAKAAVPRYQITIDSINFLAIKEYQPFIDQLVLGDQITIDTGKGYYLSTALLEYDFSYEDPSKFTIVLSNRQRLDDSHFILADMIMPTTKNTSNINFIGASQTVSLGGSKTMEFSGGIFVGGNGLTGESSTSGGIITIVDLTGGSGSNFTLPDSYISGTLSVFVNGVMQRNGQTFSEMLPNALVMLDPVFSTDAFIVTYSK